MSLRAILAIAVLLACATPAQADDFPVVNNSDSVSCGTTPPGSLRAAAAQAAAHDGVDRVVFGPALDGQTITLNNACGPIPIGPGTSIDASGLVSQGRPRVEVDCAGGGSLAFYLADATGTEHTTSTARSILGLAIGGCDSVNAAINNFTVSTHGGDLSLTDTWLGLHLDGSANPNRSGLSPQGDFTSVSLTRVAIGATTQFSPVSLVAVTFTITDSLFGLAPANAAVDPGGQRGNGGSGVQLTGKGTITNSTFATENGPGVTLTGGALSDTANRWIIKSSRFGTNLSGATSPAYANAGPGLLLTSNAGALIGGTAPGEGNVIAGNGSFGIDVANGASVEIVGNSIFGNAVLGIAFNSSGIPVANDDLDADSHRMNFPVPAGATRNPDGNGTVLFDFAGAASRTVRIDAYRSAACDDSGFGEGAAYVGTASVVSGTDGKASGAVPVTGISNGDAITLLATDLTTGSLPETSEFSGCAVAHATPIVAFGQQVLSNEGSGAAPIVVHRTGDTSSPATVRVVSTNTGTATPSVDFTPLDTTVRFAAGEANATATLVVLNDSLDEPSETVGFALSDPVGVRYDTTPTTTITIDDDDPPPAGVTAGLDPSAVSVSERSQAAVLTLHRSGNTAQPVIARVMTTPGSATAGVDYEPLDRTVTIPAGETDATIRVNLLDDTAAEAGEDLHVALSDMVGATPGVASALVTIVDDDTAAPPALASQLGKLPRPKHGKRFAVRGTAVPAGAVVRVDVAVVRFAKKACRVAKANGRLRRVKKARTRAACLRAGFVRAKLTTATGRFTRTFRKGLPKGRYSVASRARTATLAETAFTAKNGNLRALRVR
jgi:hypothetical protein